MPSLRELPDFDISSSDLVVTAQLLMSRRPQLKKLITPREIEISVLQAAGFSAYDAAERALSRITSISGTLLRRALEMKEDDIVALSLLSDLYRERRDYRAALACDEMILSRQPDNNEAKLNAAKSLLALGRTDESIEAVAGAKGVPRNGLECIRLTSFREWSEQNGGQLRRVGNAEPFACHFPCVVDGRTLQIDHIVDQSPLCVVHAQEVTVIDGFVPTKNASGYVLDGQSEVACSDAFIRQANTDPRIITEPCIFLGGPRFGFSNYYHALGQNFPPLAMLLGMLEYADRKVAVPETIRPWCLKLLEEMGVATDRILFLSRGQDTLLRNVVITESHRVASKEQIRALRMRLGVNPRRQGTRRIFIGRKALRLHGRLLVNETEIARIAGEYGFEEVDTARMSIREQIDLFGQAAAICGPSGAAFGNIVFAPDGATVTCMSPRETLAASFLDLAALCNQSFCWCLGSFLPEGRSSRWIPSVPYFIVPDDFRRALELSVGPPSA